MTCAHTAVHAGRWGCKLSQKLFVGREYVLKHVRNKHAAVVEAKQEEVVSQLLLQAWDTIAVQPFCGKLLSWWPVHLLVLRSCQRLHKWEHLGLAGFELLAHSCADADVCCNVPGGLSGAHARLGAMHRSQPRFSEGQLEAVKVMTGGCAVADLRPDLHGEL